jgi:hypothetical protein
MSDFAAEFMKSMGPQVSTQLAGTLGIKKQTASQLIPSVLPLIMGGLKRQMDTRGGAERANLILNKYGSPSVLDGIGDLFASKAAEKTADPRLGGLLGEAGVSAASTLAGKFKLDSGTIMKVIVMLAPIVLGYLSRKRDQGGLGAGGIGALIDRNGDGSILDDVAGFLGSSGGLPGGGRAGGLLGGLLGGLTGRPPKRTR